MFIKTVLAFIMIGWSGCSTKVPNTLKSRLDTLPKETLKLHAQIQGTGAPVVLLHGFSSSLHTFSYMIEPLAKKYRVYALDLKGFGSSPKPRDARYSVYDQMLLVKDFMQEHNISNPIMIGHSLGAGVALSLAITGVPLKKMVLLDAAAYRQTRPMLLDWMQIPVLGKLGFYLLPARFEIKEGYKFAFYDDAKIPEKSVDILAKNLQSDNAKYAFATANDCLIPDDIDEVSQKYRHITIPTLIIWGYEDIVIRRNKAYRLHRDMPNSKLVFIPKCGHLPQEEKPQETLRAIEAFL